MPSGSISVSPEVFYRDSLGRFAAAVEKGVQRALDEIGDKGSKSAATKARAAFPKSTLGDTFDSARASATSVIWYSTHQWALGMDLGIPQHWIAPGEKGVLANEEEGFGPVSRPVLHPGVTGAHFFEKSYAEVGGQALSIFAKYIPG